MADIRTLKLALLADTKDFIAGLNKADNETKSFSNKLGSALKTGALAFAALGAAAGTAAIAIGVDAVKAAIEDDAAARKLAKTLENVSGANKDVIKQTEKYITTTMLATGVADDELRPALARLVRSTRNSVKAQELLNVALDVSKGTGKDLDSVVAALGKAYDGNTNALGKLGLGLDQSLLKSKDFNAVIGQLKKDFGGFANQEANTLEGRMKRLSLAVAEAKESFGAALLPILEQLVGFITEKGIPLLNAFLEKWDNIAGNIKGNLTPVLLYLQKIFAPILNGISVAFNTVRNALIRNQEKLQPLYDLFQAIGKFIKDTLIPILARGLGDAFIVIGNIISGVIDFIANLVSAIDSGIKRIQDFINKIQEAIDKANRIPVLGALIPDQLTSTGGKLPSKVGNTIINNIDIKGAIDPQATARQIVRVTNVANRTTGLSFNR